MTLGKAVAEIEEGLKSLLMKVKENEKADLKLIIQKTKIIASGPITSWQIDGKTVETLSAFIFLVVSFTSCLQSFPTSGSFPTPQLESISSLALSLLYGPTLTSIRDYWKIIL